MNLYISLFSGSVYTLVYSIPYICLIPVHTFPAQYGSLICYGIDTSRAYYTFEIDSAAEGAEE